MSDQEPVVLNGRYELHRRIGRGGMADVYLARDQLLDRPVAVKILFPEFATDPSFVARFRREAQSAANLNHPSIVGVYDWGKESGTYYIVMEYVDGRSLSEILRAEGPLHPQRAAEVAADVAAALGFAHRNGVVHRDIKPGNVIITAASQVKVADFGIARAIREGAEENLTQTGSVMGTATYFSPEQAQGKGVDPRSDLYSLGVVLYEMVSGRPPFQGDSPVAIAYKHVQESPPPLRSLKPDVPEAYEAITRKLLAKNPANRYASAEDLRTDLRRFCDGQAVQAESVLVPPVDEPATAAMAAAALAPVAPAREPRFVAEEREHPRRTGWFFVVVLLLLAVLAGLLFLFARTLGILDTKTVKVGVPQLIDQPYGRAKKLLEARGFKVDPKGQESTTVDEGKVIDSDPKGGTQADKGSTVRLLVSTGVGKATLKDFQNTPGTIAKQAINDAGFRDVRTIQVPDPTVAAGNVIGSNPRPGVYSKSQRIVLFVSTGPATTTTSTTSTTRPTTSRPTTSRPTTSRPTTSRPTTSRPTTSTTTRPTTTTTTTQPTTTTTRPTTTTTTTTTAPTTTTTTRPTTTTTTTAPTTTTTTQPTTTTTTGP